MPKPKTKTNKFDIKSLKTAPVYRELSFVRATEPSADRTIEIAFASETPYERYWGIEILDCEKSSIDLARLLNNAPLLFNHDADRYIGVVQSVEIGADRICRAVVRFGRGAEAEQFYQDVLDGILTKVSVGYMINELILESEKEGASTYRVTNWTPFEISMVTIPADDTVGQGRSFEDDSNENLNPATTTPAPLILKDQTKMEFTPEQIAAREAEFKRLSAAEQDALRVRALQDIYAKYAEYLKPTDLQDACLKNHTPGQLQELVIERQRTQHSDTSNVQIGMNEKEMNQYSIARAVAAVVSGDWSKAGLELAASEASAKKFGGLSGRGFILPYDMLAKRDFTVGTAAEAGNLVATDLRTDLFVDVLRNKLSLGKLGVTMLYGLTSAIDIPRKTAGSVAAFLAETAAATETTVNTGKITLAPKRISSFIEFSKQAVVQSALAVEPMLRSDILSEFNVRVEDAAINGSGAGANPRGIRNTSGIGSVVGGANGAQIDWSHVVGLESAVANVNAEPDVNAGYLVNTKTRGWLKQKQKAANLPFIWDNSAQPLNGYRAEVTNNVLSNLTKGTANGVASSMLYSSMWDMQVLGFFGSIEILFDELSLATNGMNRLILNAFIDTGCRRPANFAVMDDGLTA
jgi:HK97 family phage major capsid protein